MRSRPDHPLPLVALGTALVLVTYVTPMATLPRTALALGSGPSARAWILSSMSVGLAAALLASGGVGDAHGRRRAYVAGLIATGVGAVGCALAPTTAWFVASRVLEGIGGAAVLACGLAILAHEFPAGAARAHAAGVWGASVGVGIAVGAVSAAALDVGSGWRETYAVVGLATLALVPPTLAYVPESSTTRRRRVDVPGVLLLAAAMTCLIAALTQGRAGLDVPTTALAASALLLLLAFAWTEVHVDEPLVDPALLRERRFLAATAASLVLGAGMIGMAAFVPTVAQVGLGSSLWVASLLVLVWAATSVATSLAARWLPHPLTGPRPLALLLVAVACGQLLALGLTAGSSPWRLVPSLVLTGLATGVLNAVLGRESVASVPPDQAAMGSGANNTARYLGAACGITLFTVVATHVGSGAPAARLVQGWNTAVVVAAAMTLLGAACIGWLAHGDVAPVDTADGADNRPAAVDDRLVGLTAPRLP